MAANNIEARLTALETGLKEVRRAIAAEKKQLSKEQWGAFAGDSDFAEAMLLGRKWRASQRANAGKKRKLKANDRARHRSRKLARVGD